MWLLPGDFSIAFFLVFVIGNVLQGYSEILVSFSFFFKAILKV